MRVQLPELVRTEYGWLMLAKFVALCLLGVIGWRQRRSGRRGAAGRPGSARTADPAGAGRGGVFGATFGIAVGLGRTPPPPLPPNRVPVEVAIGYDFAGPPTVARVLFDWRFDLIFGTAAIVMAVRLRARRAPVAPPR